MLQEVPAFALVGGRNKIKTVLKCQHVALFFSLQVHSSDLAKLPFLML